MDGASSRLLQILIPSTGIVLYVTGTIHTQPIAHRWVIVLQRHPPPLAPFDGGANVTWQRRLVSTAQLSQA